MLRINVGLLLGVRQDSWRRKRKLLCQQGLRRSAAHLHHSHRKEEGEEQKEKKRISYFFESADIESHLFMLNLLFSITLCKNS